MSGLKLFKTSNIIHKALVGAALSSAMALTTTGPSSAQEIMRQSLKPFAEVSSLDDRGVDIASGFSFFQLADVGIGNLQHMIFSRPGRLEAYDDVIPLKDNFYGAILPAQFRFGPHNDDCENGSLDVMTENIGKVFCINNDQSYSAHIEDGSTLVLAPNGAHIYTNASGTKYTFVSFNNSYPRLTQIDKSNGEKVEIHYKTAAISGGTLYRVQSITNNYGYQLKYLYSRDTAASTEEARDWIKPTQIVGLNNAVDYCDPMADSCSFSRAWPTAIHDWSGSELICTTETDPKDPGTKAPTDPEPKPITTCQRDFTYINITNAAGLTVKYTLDIGARVLKVEQPDGRTIEYTYCEGLIEPGVACDFLPESQTGFGIHRNKVISVNDDGIVWNYNYHDISVTNGVTRHDYGSDQPIGLAGEEKTVYAIAFQLNAQLSYVERILEDEVTANFSHDAANRLTSLAVNGSFTEAYEYDTRGNIIKTTRTATGETPIITEASFDVICANLAKCNQPNWTKDANGNQTDYIYDANGMIKSVTMPAHDAGRKPQVRYFYERRNAYVKNADGDMVSVSPGIWVLKSESTCRNSAAQGDGCANPAEEVQMVMEYGSGENANNLRPKGFSIVAGGETRRTCYRYDDLGNKITETSPLANLTACP